MEFTFNINDVKKVNISKRPSVLAVPKQLALEAQQQAELQELIEQKAPVIIAHVRSITPSRSPLPTESSPPLS